MKAHTDKTYDAQLDDLRNKLLSLGGKVEMEIATSVRALAERDSKLAESVIDQDREVNRLEVEVDDACRRLLVLRRPATCASSPRRSRSWSTSSASGTWR